MRRQQAGRCRVQMERLEDNQVGCSVIGLGTGAAARGQMPLRRLPQAAGRQNR